MNSNFGKDLRWAGAKTAGGGTALISASSTIAGVPLIAATGITATAINVTGIVLVTGGTGLLVVATGCGLYKFFTKKN